MKYKALIEHIVSNANTYIELYEDKEQLEEVEKGVLCGLLMDVESIENQLIIEGEKIDIDLDAIIKKLNELINK